MSKENDGSDNVGSYGSGCGVRTGEACLFCTICNPCQASPCELTTERSMRLQIKAVDTVKCLRRLLGNTKCLVSIIHYHRILEKVKKPCSKHTQGDRQVQEKGS